MPDGVSTNARLPSREPRTLQDQPPVVSAIARGAPSWLWTAAVLALTFAVYSPTLRYGFVHDDRGQIVENPAVHSWRAVPSYFISYVWAGVLPEQLGNYYRPLFLLWLRVNEAICGSHVWGWHLTTILAHLLTTFLVYLLAERVAMSREVAVLAALVFGLHPAHIEGVAWVSGVTEPLLGVLFIGAFLCYLQARHDGGRALKWKLSSLFLFALALLEKETALILPGVLAVYEWIAGPMWGGPLRLRKVLAWCGEAIRKIWPYLFPILLYVPARIYALKGFSHTVTPVGAEQLLFTWPSLLWFWIRHLVWPIGLSTFYEFPAVAHPTLGNFTLPAILVVCTGIVLVACARRSRAVAFFAAWLVLPLIPLLNIRVFMADDFAHDRYLYLPSVGLAVLIAMALKKVCVGQPQWRGMPVSLLLAATCLAAALSYGTLAQSFYFKNNLTFYAYNLAKAPHNRYAQVNYAAVLGEQGRYGPALDILNDVVGRNPTFGPAVYNLAFTYYKLGKLREAEKYFLEAIRASPNMPDAYAYLGLTHFRMGRTEEAIAEVRQAIAIRPNAFGYHFELGIMLKTQHDLNGALREFKAELANFPWQQAATEQVREIQDSLRGNSAPGARRP
jgi:tetratricopeptide (TPR) repeat protein